MRVSVLFAHKYKSHHDIFPLRVFRTQLKEKGLQINFYNNPKMAASRCDLLFVTSYQIFSLFNSESDLFEYLEKVKKKGIKIVWFDTNDSADIGQSKVLDLVDIYAKEQLWSDLNQYRRKIYQGIPFKEFYKEKYLIEDDHVVGRSPITDNQIAKLRVAWNLAFTDWRIHGKSRFNRNLGLLFPKFQYDLQTIATPIVLRPLDVSYRSPKREQKIVDFHRELARKCIKEVVEPNKYRAVYEGTVDFQIYKKELTKVRVIPSPFGWGEICYRDFECFCAGAVLLKPDMNHLQTFPNIYKANETYVSHSWDFSDFKLKLNKILEKPKDFQSIANNGQHTFIESLSKNKGGRDFAEHFWKLIN